MMDKKRVFYPILNNVIGFLTQRVWQNSFLGTRQLADPPRIKKTAPSFLHFFPGTIASLAAFAIRIFTTILPGILTSAYGGFGDQ
jgi:hypothetical protein